MFLSKCAMRDSNIWRFNKEQEASALLSSLHKPIIRKFERQKVYSSL